MFLSKKIPYYGKYNTISEVTLLEDNKKYLVTRYNDQGQEKNEIFTIVNKNKNTELLMKDYYQNVKEYLTKNKEKYISCKEQKLTLKKDFDLNFIKKLKKILKSTTSIAALIIFLSLFTNSAIILYYIGLLILIPSSTGLLLLNDISKELDIKNFIKDYEEFEYYLREYELKIENQNKKTLTEYNGLNKEKSKGNDWNLKKIRTLESKIA